MLSFPTEPRLLAQWPLPRREFLSCSLPCSVVIPLSLIVCHILGITDDLSTTVGRVLSGVLIWEGPSRGVFQVGEGVVVEVAQELEQAEHGVLQFLPNITTLAPWD